MSQPEWKLVANLGDADPISYGGFLIFEDQTGVYPPEAEVWVEPPDDSDKPVWIVYRFSLDRCTYTKGIVSDNPQQPMYEAWFADTLKGTCSGLADVASYVGCEELDLINLLCSDDTFDRATAYRDIASFYGLAEFDQYPTIYRKEEIEDLWRALKATLPKGK